MPSFLRHAPLSSIAAILVGVLGGGCGGADATADSSADFTEASADLPTFPRIDLSITREINPNRDFVAVESNGLLDFTNAAGFTETMELRLESGGGAPVTVRVPLTAGEPQADVLAALQTELQKASFTSEIDYRDGGFTKVSIYRPSKTVRPPPKRDLGDLSVVFRAVSLAEQSGDEGALNDGPTQVAEDGHVGPRHNEAFAAISQDLKSFLSFGDDSLTHYEAQTLGLGLGVISEPGISGQTYRSGDRVEVETSDATGRPMRTRGIVMSAFDRGAKPDAFEIVAVIDGRYTQLDESRARITRLLAGALLDHR